MLLRSFESFEKTENGYLIHGDAADVKLIFMTDDIIRVRVHFDKGTPMEEESYTLVTTAWPDRMDDLLKDERTRIIAQLHEQGMFELRGAVQFTVKKLSCSQASIYRYIKKAKAGENAQNE